MADPHPTLETALRTLRLFNEKVTRLEKSRFAQRYGEEPPEVLVNWGPSLTTQVSGTNIEITGEAVSELVAHDQDDIDAFVLTYRMFVQANDRISIRQLSKIYTEPWMPEEPAQSFAHARGVVNRYLAEAIAVVIYGQQISRSTLVDVMLYGGLAHSDPAKEEIYQNWVTSMVAGFFWAEFIATMYEMLTYLKFFRELNEAVLTNCAE